MRILEVEGPIHIEELTRRLVEVTGGKRVGKRAAASLQGVLQFARRRGGVSCDGPFYDISERKECPIRNRSEVSSQSLRKPEMIPPAEIRAAVVCLVAAHHGATCEEVVTATARALGFAATSAQLRSAIERELATIANQGDVTMRDGKLYPPPEKLG
jgi:hypothetical protein